MQAVGPFMAFFAHLLYMFNAAKEQILEAKKASSKKTNIMIIDVSAKTKKSLLSVCPWEEEPQARSACLKKKWGKCYDTHVYRKSNL